MRTFSVEAVGMCPLLMHGMNEETLEPESQSEGSKPDSTILPSGPKWWGYAYFDAEIGCYIPAENIYKMHEMAGNKVVFKSPEKMGGIAKSFIFAQPDKIQLLEDGKPVTRLEDLKPFKKACDSRGGKGGGRVLRIRPIFYKWSINYELVVINDDIPEDRILKVVELAGIRIGLCDWRPLFGRFIADIKLKK